MVCEIVATVALKRVYENVLILVLMEYGLRGFNSALGTASEKVLILVLMEYGLRALPLEDLLQILSTS